MKVLYNHYKDKPTIIIGDRIINGCQDFTIDQLDDMCNRYEVTDKQKQQVIDVYKQHMIDGDDNIDQFLKDDQSVHFAIAQHGNDGHRDVLVNDMDWSVRRSVALYGNDKHRDVLVNDKEWSVRRAVAQYGNDGHRDVLVNDKEDGVCISVAQYRNEIK